MSTINIEDSVVLIIDIQEKLVNAAYNKDEVIKNSQIISKAAKILDIPTIATEQYPKGLGNTIEGIESCKTFEKISFSALDSEEISSNIKNTGKKQVILMGIETHICVNQTASALIKNGYEVYVIQNACSSRAESEHLAGLDRMKSFGAEILTAEIAVFEWLKTAKHPKFKEVQALIK